MKAPFADVNSSGAAVGASANGEVQPRVNPHLVAESTSDEELADGKGKATVSSGRDLRRGRVHRASPIVAKPLALMAVVFPWNRDGQIRTGFGSDELKEKDHGQDDVTGSTLLTTEGGIVTAMAVYGGSDGAVLQASAPVTMNLRKLKRFCCSDKGDRSDVEDEVEGIVFPAREMLQGSSHLPLGAALWEWGLEEGVSISPPTLMGFSQNLGQTTGPIQTSE